jgi:magnesium chelatase family protein
VEVTPVTFDQMTETRKAETSRDIQQRVETARQRQAERFKDFPEVHSNALMPSQMVKDICQISQAGRTLLKTAMERLGLSARAYDRILKVARTIADLAGKEEIEIQHLAEAIQYRSLDREGWAG